MSERSHDNDQTVITVQWLRGIAAAMVVLHHARSPRPWLHNPLAHYDGLAWGVDIFFVISGFILYVATRDEPPLRFVQRRFIRVVPLYWLATLGLLFTAAVAGADPGVPSWDHFMRSMLFVPHRNPAYPDQIWPYLVPGWTLNYEVFFYAVFFCGLLVKKPLLTVTAAMVVLVALGWVLRHSPDPLVRTYTDTLMLEFAAGLWIGRLYLDNRLGRWLVVALPLGFIGLLVVLPAVAPIPFSKIARLVCSALIVAGAVAAARTAPSIPLLKALGDASYSIYLTHVVIALPVGRAVASRLPLEGLLQFVVWMIAALVLSLAVGWATHRMVEKPLLRWLRPPAPRPATVPAVQSGNHST